MICIDEKEFIQVLKDELKKLNLTAKNLHFDHQEGRTISGQLEGENFGISFVPEGNMGTDAKIMLVWLLDQPEIKTVRKLSKFFGAWPVSRYQLKRRPERIYYEFHRTSDHSPRKLSQCLEFIDLRVPECNLFDLAVRLRQAEIDSDFPKKALRKQTPKETDIFWIKGGISQWSFYIKLGKTDGQGGFDSALVYFKDWDGSGLVRKFSKLFGYDPFITYQRRSEPGHFYQWKKVIDDTVFDDILEDKEIIEAQTKFLID